MFSIQCRNVCFYCIYSTTQNSIRLPSQDRVFVTRRKETKRRTYVTSEKVRVYLSFEPINWFLAYKHSTHFSYARLTATYVPNLHSAHDLINNGTDIYSPTLKCNAVPSEPVCFVHKAQHIYMLPCSYIYSRMYKRSANKALVQLRQIHQICSFSRAAGILRLQHDLTPAFTAAACTQTCRWLHMRCASMWVHPCACCRLFISLSQIQHLSNVFVWRDTSSVLLCVLCSACTAWCLSADWPV